MTGLALTIATPMRLLVETRAASLRVRPRKTSSVTRDHATRWLRSSGVGTCFSSFQ